MAARVLVAVVRGGTSGEREISLLSGGSVRDGLVREGFPTLDVVIDEDGFVSIDGAATIPIGSALAHLKERGAIVFPVLHGPFGEDGVFQGALETAGLDYVGSGVAASAVAMDKLLSRRIAQSIGLSIAPGVEGGPDDSPAETQRIADAAERLGFPLFVKPACSGSSVGVTRVKSRAELEPAITLALREGGRVVVEAGVAGAEVSCPILGDAGLESRALPLIAIVPKGHDFFDYEAKYSAGHSDEICPAPVSKEISDRVSVAAKAIHDTLGCASISRSDFIVRDDGSCVFLEVNTMPGMSPLSLVPKSLAAAGIPFQVQCGRWVEEVQRRAARKVRR